MLILTRKLGESIIIDENVQISVVEINKNNIKIGVNAPKELTIYREEVFLKIKEENAQSSSSGIIDFIDFSSTTLEV
ncbi:MAG: carbon storage regulator CsrA [Candidatus Brocadiales bacterium]|nr:carbon storage regulator CsrA [Candidatus Brocadiales bacterium]